MTELAIRTVGLGKRYRRGLQLEPYKTAREALTKLAKRPFGGSAPEPEDRWFWALKDIELDFAQGESVGIIGRNGAGKTTLLKVLSQVTKPSAGHAEVRGRVGTLLEVGTAFHPELTGRENIKLNGAILGMSRGEIMGRFDEIVEFAEVEKFIDTPVKRYSSGMYMRLAFAVAAHMEPDILIVDEVLAVGDAAFQKKCLGKLGDVETDGRTVLFVSHNMSAVSQICQRGLVIDSGEVVYDGDIESAIEHYSTEFATLEAEIRFENDLERDASIVRLATVGAGGDAVARFANDEPIVMEVEFEVNRALEGDHVWMALDRADGLRLFKSLDDDSSDPVPVTREPGRYSIRFTLPPHVLNEGAYRYVAVIGKRYGHQHDQRDSAYFEVQDVTDYRDSHFGKRAGVLLPSIEVEERRLEVPAS